MNGYSPVRIGLRGSAGVPSKEGFPLSCSLKQPCHCCSWRRSRGCRWLCSLAATRHGLHLPATGDGKPDRQSRPAVPRGRIDRNQERRDSPRELQLHGLLRKAEQPLPANIQASDKKGCTAHTSCDLPMHACIGRCRDSRKL